MQATSDLAGSYRQTLKEHPGVLTRLRCWGWAGSWCLACLFAWGCRSTEPPPPPAPKSVSSLALPSTTAPLGSALPSATLELQRQIRAQKLRLSPARVTLPRLAFGRGLFGQLTQSELRVFDTRDYRLLAKIPLQEPRLLVTLASGSLLAVGRRVSLRFDPGAEKAVSFGRPLLLPGAELLPDSIEAERVWVFDAGSSGNTGAASQRGPTLASYRLETTGGGLPLPEKEVAFESPPGGSFGRTREGVWLYFTAARAERFSPSGHRLSALKLPELPALVRVLPARRLDQCYLLAEPGRVLRVLVTPTFRQLQSAELGGVPFSAETADEGRLLAVVSLLPGVGHRFQLELFDAELGRRARMALPEEAPTGGDDWVRVVTENQTVVASASEPRLAVGGPSRALILDEQGQQVFSIPSM